MDGLNTYFVSRAAHQAGLKVALSGLGGDEIFGGYSTFAATPRAVFVAGLGRWVPGPLRRLTANAAVKIASGDAVRKAAATWRSPQDFPHAYYFTRTLFTPSRVSSPACASLRVRRSNRGARNDSPAAGACACRRRRGRRAASIPSPPFPVSNCSPTWSTRFCAIPTPSAWPIRSKFAFRCWITGSWNLWRGCRRLQNTGQKCRRRC